MKVNTIRFLFVGILLVGSVTMAEALESRKAAVLSRLQSMTHGYHSETEWVRVFTELSELRDEAERQEAYELVVDSAVIEAMVYSDLRGEHERALRVLERVKEQYYGRPVDNLRRIFVKLAEVHARLGDEAAITALIQEFRQSPHYDPESYAYTGGLGREVPLAVTRPRASGNDSITVTSMQRYRTQSRFAVGRPFPDFEATGADGRIVRLSDFRGRPVLIDFWFPEWTAWSRDLPNLIRTYEQFRPAGFEVIGVFLGRDQAARDAFVRSQGMRWVQLNEERRLPTRLGIFGEAQNMLIDGNGVIMGRNLHGAALTEALRQLVR